MNVKEMKTNKFLLGALATFLLLFFFFFFFFGTARAESRKSINLGLVPGNSLDNLKAHHAESIVLLNSDLAIGEELLPQLNLSLQREPPLGLRLGNIGSLPVPLNLTGEALLQTDAELMQPNVELKSLKLLRANLNLQNIATGQLSLNTQLTERLSA